MRCSVTDVVVWSYLCWLHWIQHWNGEWAFDLQHLMYLSYVWDVVGAKILRQIHVAVFDAASSVWILEGEACHIKKAAGTKNRCSLHILCMRGFWTWHLTCVHQFLQHIFPRSDTGFLYWTQCTYLPRISIHIQVPVTLGNEMLRWMHI